MLVVCPKSTLWGPGGRRNDAPHSSVLSKPQSIDTNPTHHLNGIRALFFIDKVGAEADLSMELHVPYKTLERGRTFVG